MVLAVRDRAMLSGPASLRTSEWVYLPPSIVAAEDVGACPYSVAILVKWVAFTGTLHWPAAAANLGLVGFLMLECSSFTSSGLMRVLFLKRLFPGARDPGVQFQCRLFCLVQAFRFGAHVGTLELS